MAKKTLVVKAQKREQRGTGPSRRLRRQLMVPGVVYGHEYAGLPIVMDAMSAKALSKHTGLATLEIEGQKEPAQVILRDMQHNFIKNIITHIDLQAVSADEKIRSMVSVSIFGECPGERSGGILDQQLYELEIECLPKDLPETIRIDVSKLELDMTLHVRDIEPPPGVRFTAEPNVSVVQVRLPRIATAAAETAEGAAAEAGAEGAAAAGADKDKKEADGGKDKK